MKNDLYRKLVDLYAGQELPSELEAELEAAAKTDPALEKEMKEMRVTVDLLHSMNPPEFSQETYQRTLLKLYTRAAEARPTHTEEPHWQYRLPMQG